MDRDQVHFEVFARRPNASHWTLELATEDRARALEAAEEMLAEHRAAAVRVTKETLDEETREYRTVTILTKGALEKPKSKADVMEQAPLCTGPADLYTVHARERIGRLLQDWLNRQRATPFELLHRPDLIEKLDASGLELQHAVQKLAVPEAQASRHPICPMPHRGASGRMSIYICPISPAVPIVPSITTSPKTMPPPMPVLTVM